MKDNFCNIVNVFTVMFDPLNASLLIKIINFLKNRLTDPKPVNGSIYVLLQIYYNIYYLL